MQAFSGIMLPLIKRRRLELEESNASEEFLTDHDEDMDPQQIRAHQMGPMLQRFLDGPLTEFARKDPSR